MSYHDESGWFSAPYIFEWEFPLSEEATLLETFVSSVTHPPFARQFNHGNYFFYSHLNQQGQAFLTIEMPTFDTRFGKELFGKSDDENAELYCRKYAEICAELTGGALADIRHIEASERLQATIRLNGVVLENIPPNMTSQAFKELVFAKNNTDPLAEEGISRYRETMQRLATYTREGHVIPKIVLKEALQQRPSASISEAFQTYQHFAAPDSQISSTAQRYVGETASHDIAVIEQKLCDKGFDRFSFEGVGRVTDAFNAMDEHGNRVVVCIRSRERLPERAPLPHCLQALAGYQEEALSAEILPYVQYRSVKYDDVSECLADMKRDQLAAGGELWVCNDPVYVNFGINPLTETTYFMDGDGMTKKAEGEFARPIISPTHTDENGVWKQYDEWQELHERFDSMLHRMKGALGAVGAGVYTANNHNKPSRVGWANNLQ